MEKFAPKEWAEEWDNVGLLVHRADGDVQKVLVCLDFSEATLNQAISENCQMMITHHPVIFKPIRSLENPLILKAVQQNICVYSAHTNLDAAPGGVNDALAERLGLQNVQTEGILRFGSLEKPMSAADFAEHVKNALHVSNLRTCPLEKQIQRVGLVGGSGGDFIAQAVQNRCDAFVTGEASYHEAQAALENDLFLVCAGHFETEVPVVQALCRYLKAHLPELLVIEGKDKNPFPIH